MMKRWRLVAATIGLVMWWAGCRGPATLSVQDAWGRSTPASTTTAAFYLTVINPTDRDDDLVGASAAACGTIEVHETIKGANDVMRMRPLPQGLPVPAGSTVRLEPGGAHLMCLDRQRAFRAGDQIPLRLTFRQAGALEAVAEIRDDS